MNLLTNRVSLLLFGALLTLAACSDEEDPSRRDLLIGTWEIQSGELVDYQVTIEGATLDRSAVQGLAVLNPDIASVDQAIAEGADVLFPSGTTIVFNDNGQYTLNDLSDIIENSWTLSDDEQQVTVQTGSTVGPSQLVFELEELTSQQVSFILDLDETAIDLENQGADDLPLEVDDFSIQYRFNFSKQ
ncbi:MAG: hypothetical protein ACFB15_29220 [Cyclobacteriaceae bacterium]